MYLYLLPLFIVISKFGFGQSYFMNKFSEYNNLRRRENNVNKINKINNINKNVNKLNTINNNPKPTIILNSKKIIYPTCLKTLSQYTLYTIPSISSNLTTTTTTTNLMCPIIINTNNLNTNNLNTNNLNTNNNLRVREQKPLEVVYDQNLNSNIKFNLRGSYSK